MILAIDKSVRVPHANREAAMLEGDDRAGSASGTEREVCSLVGLSAVEIGALPALAGEAPYRGRQLAVWVYRKGAQHFEEMTNLSRALRRRLATHHSLARLPVTATRLSRDRSAEKFLFTTDDGCGIEAVLLRAPRRDTICLSTQAGCAYGCRFCATAAMGLQRDLTRHEILSQLLTVREALAARGGRGFVNVVFMGMGEPLANYANLIAVLRLLADDHGPGIGRRRITVSTVGLPAQIRRLAEEPVSVRLALSLNATENRTRSRLMPINRRHPIEEILPAIDAYRRRSGQRTTLEYILLRGINDTLEDARRLAQLARRHQCGVNLIPFNAHPLSELQPSPPGRVRVFREALLPLAPQVTLRESRGADILAACGQLSTAYDGAPGGAGGA
jgi:23S rRNA (adenine2503-C2)-methyltransferase